jgi:hydrogenase maturation protease
MTDRTRAPRVLVAGIGNIFFGDDGFGVEVVQRMAGVHVPESVKVVDFGIRGVHLAYELLNGYDALVLVDALPVGEEPGTVVLVEAEQPESPSAGDDLAPTIEAHSMNPALVLGMLASLGGRVDRILVIGCQPLTVEEGIGLSEPVAAAVDHAVEAVSEVLTDLFETAEQETPA